MLMKPIDPPYPWGFSKWPRVVLVRLILDQGPAPLDP